MRLKKISSGIPFHSFVPTKEDTIEEALSPLSLHCMYGTIKSILSANLREHCGKYGWNSSERQERPELLRADEILFKEFKGELETRGNWENVFSFACTSWTLGCSILCYFQTSNTSLTNSIKKCITIIKIRCYKSMRYCLKFYFRQFGLQIGKLPQLKKAGFTNCFYMIV